MFLCRHIVEYVVINDSKVLLQYWYIQGQRWNYLNKDIGLERSKQTMCELKVSIPLFGWWFMSIP